MTYTRTVITIEVLSADLLTDERVYQVADAVALLLEDVSTMVTNVEAQEVDRELMAALLTEQGSDPQFLIPDWPEEPIP